MPIGNFFSNAYNTMMGGPTQNRGNRDGWPVSGPVAAQGILGSEQNGLSNSSFFNSMPQTSQMVNSQYLGGAASHELGKFFSPNTNPYGGGNPGFQGGQGNFNSAAYSAPNFNTSQSGYFSGANGNSSFGLSDASEQVEGLGSADAGLSNLGFGGFAQPAGFSLPGSSQQFGSQGTNGSAQAQESSLNQTLTNENNQLSQDEQSESTVQSGGSAPGGQSLQALEQQVTADSQAIAQTQSQLSQLQAQQQNSGGTSLGGFTPDTNPTQVQQNLQNDQQNLQQAQQQLTAVENGGSAPAGQTLQSLQNTVSEYTQGIASDQAILGQSAQ